MTTEPQTYSCTVCLEHVDDSNSSECNGCGERYHLNQRNDRPGKDCGDVWINDETLALEFGCQTCIDAVNQEQSPAAANPALQAFLSQLPPDMVPDALRAAAMPAASTPPEPVVAPAAGRTRRYRRRE